MSTNEALTSVNTVQDVGLDNLHAPAVPSGSMFNQGATTVNLQHCNGFGSLPAHDADPSAFSKGKSRCRTCTAAYFKDWQTRKAAQAGTPAPASAVLPTPSGQAPEPVVVAPAPQPAVQRELVSVERDIGHTYRPNPKLVTLWDAILKASKRGDYLVLTMHGPHGSGKTDAGEFLAKRAGLPYVKVDAKSMVDAEAWFGTRGAVEGSTFYHPSEFVLGLQRACVIQIDEYTRVTNEVRDVLNPFMDGTRSVLNPITGDRIVLHPECIVILSGNVGFKYTGVFDVDPATTSRLAVINIDYPEPDVEKAIIAEHTGIDAAVIERLVNLGQETRSNPKFEAVSTRQLIQTAVLVRDGLDETEAVEAKIINAASDQGDGASLRSRLNTLWGGIANDEPKIVTSEEDYEVLS